jgi:hypothetical protein
MPFLFIEDNMSNATHGHHPDPATADSRRPGEPVSGQGKASGKIANATKAIRAITAIVVFGVPLVTGTATLLGYGVYKAYKRMTGRS